MNSKSKKLCAQHIVSELLGEHSKARLIDYWKGKLDSEATAAIDAEMNHDPKLRERLAEIVEELREELDEIKTQIVRNRDDGQDADLTSSSD